MKAPQLSPAFLFQLPVLLVLAPVAGMSAPELVSAKADGSQGNSWSNDAEASTSGRYVTFASSATDLVPDDTNSALDIFVKDRVTGAIERVSVDSTGTQAIGSSQGETGSRSPSISGDGRYVVFTSGATNLVAGDANNRTDIFLKDRQTGALTLVSVTAAGARSDSHCREPRISADGRFVVFSSQASTFVPGASTNHNIYLKDLATGAIEQVSVDSNEAQFNGSAYESAVSGDGSRVVFSLENFSDGTFHLYLRDRSAGTSEIISRHSDGTPGNHQSFGARITPDGRHVAFWSDASNLVDSDANSSRDVFVRHLDTATTELASVSGDET